jgi:hypothetical protein
MRLKVKVRLSASVAAASRRAGRARVDIGLQLRGQFLRSRKDLLGCDVIDALGVIDGEPGLTLVGSELLRESFAAASERLHRSVEFVVA